MAVARTAGGSVAWTNNSTTSPNCSVDGTGANFLVVFIAWRNTGSTTISGVIYNSVAMTRLGSVFTSASPRQDVDIFYLASPSSGSNNVVATSSAAIGGAGNDGVIYAHALSGVDTGTPFGTRVNYEAITPFSSLDITLSAATGDLCLDVAFINGTTLLTYTADSGQTAYGRVDGGTVAAIDSSSEPGAASVAMGWDWTPNLTYNAVQSGVPVKAAAASSSLLIRPRGLGGGIQGLNGGMNS